MNTDGFGTRASNGTAPSQAIFAGSGNVDGTAYTYDKYVDVVVKDDMVIGLINSTGSNIPEVNGDIVNASNNDLSPGDIVRNGSVIYAVGNYPDGASAGVGTITINYTPSSGYSTSFNPVTEFKQVPYAIVSRIAPDGIVADTIVDRDLLLTKLGQFFTAFPELPTGSNTGAAHAADWTPVLAQGTATWDFQLAADAGTAGALGGGDASYQIESSTGVPGGLVKDLAGNAWENLPDMGAYQSQGLGDVGAKPAPASE
jgi:hypothetical protein